MMQSMRKIIGFTSNLRGLFFGIGILGVFSALLGFVTPLILKYATDWSVAVINGEQAFSIEPVLWIVAAFVAVSLVQIFFIDVGGYMGDMMAVRARRQLSKRYYQHLLKLPQSYYDGEVTGKIINRLSRAITEITQFLQFFANGLLSMLLTVLVAVGVLFYFNVWLALLFTLLIPTSLYLTALTSSRWQKYETQKNHHFDYASGRFAEVVGQMRLVKSFATEKSELGSFDSEIGSMVGLTAKQSRWWHSMNALRTLAFGVIFAGVYGIIFYETARGAFSLGDAVLLIAIVQQASFPVRNMSFFVDNYQRAVANSRDFLAAMAQTPEINEHLPAMPEPRKGHVRYEKVDFSYSQKHQVLRDISFEIKPGQKVALVGESGGGKSTIANLLMRLYDIDAGKITIDGSTIGDYSRRSVRQSIATVFQDATLFSGTVRDNIAYAAPGVDETNIVKAAKAANAWEFITDLPDGLDTEIGERGVRLSGGQKQRISIARAIIKDAPILVLDEATSALDSRAEAEVQRALEKLMKGRTTLIIAHRLSTIAHVDTIVTLQKGRIDEIGSPLELASSGGIYSQLLKLQLGTNEATKKQLAKYDIAL